MEATKLPRFYTLANSLHELYATCEWKLGLFRRGTGPFVNDVMTSLPLPQNQNNINIPSTSPDVQLFFYTTHLLSYQ
ncbi:hypothetical protein VN97_g1688 [Penicillium thymicola]|uniref:Uncharacterized protein n=1 Tax=Penicillium thymicola TaxID=293382 RepID=A0AAI9TQI0_PENTH|nr:hypothetical protein VN97_g1688 [Penicillium thymicola]